MSIPMQEIMYMQMRQDAMMAAAAEEELMTVFLLLLQPASATLASTGLNGREQP